MHRFIRVPGFGDINLWKRLLKAPFADNFAQLFNQIAVRTSKAGAAAELTIPRKYSIVLSISEWLGKSFSRSLEQTRVLVPISLGAVERHVRTAHKCGNN